MKNPMNLFARKLAVVLSVAAIGFASQASAELDGAKLFIEKTCITCHGADAKTPIMPLYPKLAGQNYEYLKGQALDIKYGRRTNGMASSMMGIAQMASDEEIDAIVKYISTLPAQ
jgi:cytochrome c